MDEDQIAAYERGRLVGRVETLESTSLNHKEVLDTHDRRLRMAERILYGLIGAIGLIEFLPKLQSFIH